MVLHLNEYLISEKENWFHLSKSGHRRMETQFTLPKVEAKLMEGNAYGSDGLGSILCTEWNSTEIVKFFNEPT